MCEKCVELEAKIAHYRAHARQALDPLTLERINGLIADLEKQKLAIHPDALDRRPEI